MTRPVRAGEIEPTNGELGRRMDTLNSAVQDGFRRVAAEIEHVHLSHEKYVLTAVHNIVTDNLRQQIREIREELDAIQDGRRHAISTVLAGLALVVSIVVGVLSLIIK